MEHITHPATTPTTKATPIVTMEYWRVTRVARYLDISRKRVYQLVQEKKLTAIRISPRTMRILRNSVEDYLADRLAAAHAELGI